MLNEKTTFVIGAGASHEFGLPISADLARNIAKRLDIRVDYEPRYHITGDEVIVDVLSRDGTLGAMQPACWAMRDGIRSAPSIDTFIDNHNHDKAIARCGKIAIVSAIIQGERDSDLISPKGLTSVELNYPKVMSTWIGSLFMLINQGVARSSVENLFVNVSIIVFNYDRCIEQILFCLVRDHYQLNDSEAADIMSTLDIRHAYGTVGRLPWQVAAEKQAVAPVQFGSISPQQIIPVSQEIRTFTEVETDQARALELKNRVEYCSRLIFLGFSHLSQNLSLIQPREANSSREILGTLYGMSPMDIKSVDRDLNRLFFGPTSPLYPEAGWKCVDFIKSYARVLQS